MFNTVVVLRAKKLSHGVVPRKFSNDSERREKVSIILSSVNYLLSLKFYLNHLRKSRFVEDVLFYPQREEMASPKIDSK